MIAVGVGVACATTTAHAKGIDDHAKVAESERKGLPEGVANTLDRTVSATSRSAVKGLGIASSAGPEHALQHADHSRSSATTTSQRPAAMPTVRSADSDRSTPFRKASSSKTLANTASSHEAPSNKSAVERSVHRGVAPKIRITRVISSLDSVKKADATRYPISRQRESTSHPASVDDRTASSRQHAKADPVADHVPGSASGSGSATNSGPAADAKPHRANLLDLHQLGNALPVKVQNQAHEVHDQAAAHDTTTGNASRRSNAHRKDSPVASGPRSESLPESAIGLVNATVDKTTNKSNADQSDAASNAGDENAPAATRTTTAGRIDTLSTSRSDSNSTNRVDANSTSSTNRVDATTPNRGDAKITNRADATNATLAEIKINKLADNTIADLVGNKINNASGERQGDTTGTTVSDTTATKINTITKINKINFADGADVASDANPSERDRNDATVAPIVTTLRAVGSAPVATVTSLATDGTRTVLNSRPSLATAVPDAVGVLKAGTPDRLRPSVDALTTPLVRTTDQLSAVTRPVADLTDPVVRTVTGTTAAAVDPVVELVDQTGATTSSVVDPVVRPLAAPVTDVTASLVAQTGDAVDQSITAPVSSAVNATVGATVEAISPVDGLVNHVAGAVADPVGGVVSTTVDSLAPVVDGVGTVTAPITAATGPITSAITGPITSTITGPITSTITGPITSTITDPITSTITDPITSTISDAVTGTVGATGTAVITGPSAAPASTAPASNAPTSTAPLAVNDPFGSGPQPQVGPAPVSGAAAALDPAALTAAAAHPADGAAIALQSATPIILYASAASQPTGYGPAAGQAGTATVRPTLHGATSGSAINLAGHHLPTPGPSATDAASGAISGSTGSAGNPAATLSSTGDFRLPSSNAELRDDKNSPQFIAYDPGFSPD